MARLWSKLRLPLVLVLAISLGYLVESTPKSLVVPMNDGAGTVTVPRSLEGWRLKPGQGDLLLSGGTRLGLMKLQIATTGVTDAAVLGSYIADRQQADFLAHENYQTRLKGEIRTWGDQRMPVARAVYDGKFLGVTTRFVQHDVFLPYRGQYVRVGLTFPEFLDNYLGPDQYFLATHLTFAQ
jgi:hypothetical protein